MPSHPVVARLLESQTSHDRDTAWQAFVAEYSRLILHVARSVTAGHDESMDGYVHVLEQLRANDCARIRRFAADGRSKFSTWLVVVARRLCVDHVRARTGRPRDGQSEAAQAALNLRRRLSRLASDDVELDSIAEPGQLPDTVVIANELRDNLDRALESLASDDRLLVRLRFEDDLSAADIAHILGWPTPFHVYRRLTVVTTALKRLLVARGVETGIP